MDDFYGFSPEYPRPVGEEAIHNEDPMLLYFTSGTTGMPKMVQHDFTYPLGHIVTAAFWQDVVPGGVHLTVSDTGWGKAVWGKLYGQWMADTTVFTYDYDKFVPTDLLQKIAGLPHHQLLRAAHHLSLFDPGGSGKIRFERASALSPSPERP